MSTGTHSGQQGWDRNIKRDKVEKSSRMGMCPYVSMWETTAHLPSLLTPRRLCEWAQEGNEAFMVYSEYRTFATECIGINILHKHAHSGKTHTLLYLNRFPDLSRCAVLGITMVCVSYRPINSLHFSQHSCSVWRWSVMTSWENPHLYFLPLTSWVFHRGVFLFTHSHILVYICIHAAWLIFPSCVSLIAV